MIIIFYRYFFFWYSLCFDAKSVSHFKKSTPDERAGIEEPPSAPPVQPVHPLSLNVAIVGAPNAGKSSLLNLMLAQKVQSK